MALLTIAGVLMLSILSAPPSPQVSDEVAREQIRNTVRLQLHLKSSQFLSIQRDEKLEQLLATAADGRGGSVFIYRVSQAGDEVKGNTVVHHIFTDVDPSYVVAAGPAGGSTYRIHGFADSLAEFERLMEATKLKVSNPDQAQSVSDFYREVNPQHTSMAPITSLIELKQAAERQCQTGSVETGEREFDAWWERGKVAYAGIQFKQTAPRSGNGYLVQWVVLSSAAPGNCGGSPLRARLEVGPDGQVEQLNFSPLPKP